MGRVSGGAQGRRRAANMGHAPRLMKAQSCLCVRANVTLNPPPTTAMPNARKIWTKMESVSALIGNCKSFAI
jgi:hypothetical protein